MKVIHTPFEGLFVIELNRFHDDRGFFTETYQSNRYREVGIDDIFQQDNQSRSRKNVLRGMHFQVKNPQSQLVTVLRGSIYDVCVDIRINSPTFGTWFGLELHENGPQQLYMAPGFAHGFCVLSDWADIHYKVSRNFNPGDEGGLRWNDIDLGIVWPINNPVISERDLNYSSLKELKLTEFPQF